MKYLIVTVLLFGCALGARAQPHVAHPPDSTASVADASSPSLVLRASTRTVASPEAVPSGLSVTDHLTGWDAPTAAEEFPAEVATFDGPRYIDTYEVWPSSVGGWVVRIMADLACNEAAEDENRKRQCSTIGTRPYAYPRFRR